MRLDKIANGGPQECSKNFPSLPLVFPRLVLIACPLPLVQDASCFAASFYSVYVFFRTNGVLFGYELFLKFND